MTIDYEGRALVIVPVGESETVIGATINDVNFARWLVPKIGFKWFLFPFFDLGAFFGFIWFLRFSASSSSLAAIEAHKNPEK